MYWEILRKIYAENKLMKNSAKRLTIYRFQFFQISGFECASYLFRARRYKVVSPSDYATRIRTYDQSCGAACFDQQVGRETRSRNENKVKLYLLEMDHWWWRRPSRSGTVITWYLYWDLFKLYLVKNYFCFSIYFLFRSDVIFTAVCTFEILCE